MGSPTTPGATTQLLGLKRERSTSDNELGGGDPDVSRPKAGKRLKSSPVSHARLACPFFKNDLAQHQDCVKAAYQTWAHVKQHLRRKHYRHSYEESEAPSDNDISSHDSCVPGTPSIPDQIGEAQMTHIEKKTKGRSMSDRKRWSVAWGIIFPKAHPPKTPYAQGLIDELLDYVIRRVSDRPQSFDVALVNEKLVTSAAASETVANRFIGLLRDEENPATAHPRAFSRQEDGLVVTEPTSSGELPEPTHNRIPSSDFFTLHGQETSPPILARTADRSDSIIEGEESIIQWLCLDHHLWEGLEWDNYC
ncbi:hypothetical protein CGCSCA4_v002267 [Colletotrichum siamense]|uniref:Uncharacterized protein n=1 Tax=Colletotrichum siamense TaxID=690259 RepID=A0A9P5F186_COLSI|nr:hypothetical protein CGCSCA4_v002267 [Colletotrichum siamense]KAF4864172.1 hypothetical protein CGCSCA2_v002402 [Colletotrichum siamense]